MYEGWRTHASNFVLRMSTPNPFDICGVEGGGWRLDVFHCRKSKV